MGCYMHILIFICMAEVKVDGISHHPSLTLTLYRHDCSVTSDKLRRRETPWARFHGPLEMRTGGSQVPLLHCSVLSPWHNNQHIYMPSSQFQFSQWFLVCKPRVQSPSDGALCKLSNLPLWKPEIGPVQLIGPYSCAGSYQIPPCISEGETPMVHTMGGYVHGLGKGGSGHCYLFHYFHNKVLDMHQNITRIQGMVCVMGGNRQTMKKY